MTILYIAIALIVAYLIGSVPTSVWLGKLVFKKDIREMGSGNAGATNVFRNFGWHYGVLVLVLDAFKGWAAVKFGSLLPIELTHAGWMDLDCACAVLAVIGHVFPLFANFKGGKGVATLLGIGIALFPFQVLIVIGVFALLFAATRIISISSIIAAFSFPFIVFFLPVDPEPTVVMHIFAILVGIVIPLTHKSNIIRLINGDEKRLVSKKRDK